MSAPGTTGGGMLGASGNNLVYTASPTLARFMSSAAFIRFVLGPVGSGKTTGVMFEVFRRACEQRRGPDGKRRTRFVIVRNTLSQMKQTVLKDIEMWLGPVAHFKSSENVVEIRAGDVHSDWYLIPLDDPQNQQRLLSLQLTGAWLNEFIEIDPDLIPPIAGRLNRFPSAAQGGATWSGIIGDSNMPNAGTRWHELLGVTIPEDWGVEIQPGGMEPNAENLNFLAQTEETLKLRIDHPLRLAQGRSYYERLLRQHAGNWIKRYVHAQFGDDPDGTAVFRESFNRDFHVAPGRVEPSDGMPLTVGQDFGRNPCALITQLDHKGRLLVLKEVVSTNIGLGLHIDMNLRPILNSDERFIGKRIIMVGDPAGTARNDHSEMDSFQFLESNGFHAYPAPTNLIDPRLQAVEAAFAHAPGGKPMVVIDPEGCPNLIAALHSKYLFAKRRDGETRSLPEKKHPWSDLADCFQYVCLCVQGGYQLQIREDIMRRNDVNRVARPAPSQRAWT